MLLHLVVLPLGSLCKASWSFIGPALKAQREISNGTTYAAGPAFHAQQPVGASPREVEAFVADAWQVQGDARKGLLAPNLAYPSLVNKRSGGPFEGIYGISGRGSLAIFGLIWGFRG